MYVRVCRYQGERMKNVFVVNDQYDAAVALYWLENNVLNSQTGDVTAAAAFACLVHVHYACRCTFVVMFVVSFLLIVTYCCFYNEYQLKGSIIAA